MTIKFSGRLLLSDNLFKSKQFSRNDIFHRIESANEGMGWGGREFEIPSDGTWICSARIINNSFIINLGVRDRKSDPCCIFFFYSCFTNPDSFYFSSRDPSTPLVWIRLKNLNIYLFHENLFLVSTKVTTLNIASRLTGNKKGPFHILVVESKIRQFLAI